MSRSTCNLQRLRPHRALPTSYHYAFVSASSRSKYNTAYSRHRTLLNSFTSGQNANETSKAIATLTERIPPGIAIYDALQLSIELLEECAIPEPEESALHLLSHALNLSWESGYRELREVSALPSPLPERASANSRTLDLAQKTLTQEQSIAYQTLMSRRLQFEPLQYIVGRWDFHHLTGLTIRKPMLCPRPETEELVEFVMSDIEHLNKQQRKVRVLDVGCGTGAIGIAIARQYPEHVQVVALDVSPEAVALSNDNAAEFLSDLIGKGNVDDVYQALLCSATDFTNHNEQRYEMNFDLVVSNPPYIPAKDMRDLSTDVVGYESQSALCGGEDGLDVIRDIVRRLPEWVFSDDHSQIMKHQRHCWMEVDDSHPTLIAQWLAPGSEESIRWGVEYSESRKDFCGRDRFVKLVVK
ncbi:hypothetical protein ACHAXT_000425 [Thalassiosira profunda]